MNEHFSIIIPTYNEGENIFRLVTYLKEHANQDSGLEIIVVDGGSMDNTVFQAEEGGAEVVISEKGRGVQMNKGASMATGEVLYFLHADTFPPPSYYQDIISKIDDQFQAGAFRMKFDSSHPLLTISGWFTKFNISLCNGGDQSLFIRRELFERINGFRAEMVVMEDVEIISRVRKYSNFRKINKTVITSARKYKRNGYFKLQIIFGLMHLLYFLGYPVDTIERFYNRSVS